MGIKRKTPISMKCEKVYTWHTTLRQNAKSLLIGAAKKNETFKINSIQWQYKYGYTITRNVQNCRTCASVIFSSYL